MILVVSNGGRTFTYIQVGVLVGIADAKIIVITLALWEMIGMGKKYVAVGAFSAHRTQKLPIVQSVQEQGDELVLTVMEIGYTTSIGACTAHSINGMHYYCTSSSKHGTNVNQYH